MPLSDALTDVANRIVGFYERNSSPPFLVYQYEPADEYAVRQELLELKLWLDAKHDIGCQTISLAEIFWEALEDNGQLDMIIELERDGFYDDSHKAVQQVLARDPTIADRVVQRSVDQGDEREAIFLGSSDSSVGRSCGLGASG